MTSNDMIFTTCISICICKLLGIIQPSLSFFLYYNALLLVVNDKGVLDPFSKSLGVFGHKADAIGELRLGTDREREQQDSSPPHLL
jgi:hypothetical protein